MQFLSDVYLRCPDCDGKRYRPEILEVRIERLRPVPGSARPAAPVLLGAAPAGRRGRWPQASAIRTLVRPHAGGAGTRVSLNVADVLNLTVSEAAVLFANDREVIRALQPIVDVGLEYVKLGQPVPTLSGGEAQRLKLAGFLAEAARSGSSSRQPVARRGTLFMFDEPTTGLHFDDIAKLMRALRKLLDAGHSLLVIEHNLDVIRASDWLIDLGPEGGEAGGLVVAVGTPDQLRQHPDSHTGRRCASTTARRRRAPACACRTARVCPTPEAGSAPAPDAIQIVNAKEHNLRALSVDIPRGRFSVVTGVSGSGKSTLAFDILFNEGQRRYLESLNAYARSIVQPAGRPEVDAVYGIPPTVAIEQRLSRGGRKSTVGTATEVWHFLRLLYRQAGGAALRARRRGGRPADARQHRGAAAAPVPRPAHRPAGATGGEPQGRLHRAGRLGPPAGLHPPACGWQFLPTTGFPRIDRFKEHTIELPVLSLDVSPGHEAALREAWRRRWSTARASCMC
jgi:excinuclease ABC subunit A